MTFTSSAAFRSWSFWLRVSEATVKTHVNRIVAKTGSRDRMQAMRYAYTHGFADPASQAAPRPDAPQ